MARRKTNTNPVAQGQRPVLRGAEPGRRCDAGSDGEGERQAVIFYDEPQDPLPHAVAALLKECLAQEPVIHLTKGNSDLVLLRLKAVLGPKQTRCIQPQLCVEAGGGCECYRVRDFGPVHFLN